MKLEYKIIKDWEYCKKEKNNGFIPIYADKEDLNLLNRFMEMQSCRDSKDEIDILFADKTAFAKSSVINTISQIKERIGIKYNNLNKIDYSISGQRSRLFQLEDLFNDTSSPVIIKARNDIEKSILDSEKEKRGEETSCWRDIAELRKNLMFAMNEYKTNAMKKQLITGNSLEGVVQYE